MNDQYRHFFTKPIPKTILIFGASGRIGGPMAGYLTQEAPSIKLRLSTSNEKNIVGMQARFPDAEIVVSDYMDLSSLEKAVDGMEGIFCVTPMLTDEKPAMENLIAAVKKSGTLVHMIRQIGLMPEVNVSCFPEALKKERLTQYIQHPLARKILESAGLPVTFLNTAASFMTNFAMYMVPGLRRERKLIWPERRVPYIDTDEVGEIAARLLLSNDRRHIGQFHSVNNGYDFPTFEEIAALMSEVWGETIGYDGSKEAFWAEFHMLGEPMLNIIWEMFDFERSIEVTWALNNCAETILGRKPKTLRQWLIENRKKVLGPEGDAVL